MNLNTQLSQLESAMEIEPEKISFSIESFIREKVGGV